jgi:hypothetical protein
MTMQQVPYRDTQTSVSPTLQGYDNSSSGVVRTRYHSHVVVYIYHLYVIVERSV